MLTFKVVVSSVNDQTARYRCCCCSCFADCVARPLLRSIFCYIFCISFFSIFFIECFVFSFIFLHFCIYRKCPSRLRFARARTGPLPPWGSSCSSQRVRAVESRRSPASSPEGGRTPSSSEGSRRTGWGVRGERRWRELKLR